MWRVGEKRSAVRALGPKTETLSGKKVGFLAVKLGKKGAQAFKNVKNFHKRLASGLFYRHNRGLRLAKGVGICPN